MRRILPVVALLSSFTLAPAPIGPRPADAGAHQVAQADVVPLPQVLSQIARRYPGRALDARMQERGGRPIYWIKWLAEDGKVWEIVVDARTGQILSAR